MKRLIDDGYGNPPFKRPFGSSRGESCGQSQIPESGLGGGGGGSRSRAGASANYKPKLIINDALSYLKEVKNMFRDQMEKYDMFLDVMKDFKYQRIDIDGVIARVKDLFKGHPSLLLGMNPLLPKGYKIILNDDDEAPQRKTDEFDQAISLVTKIKERFGNDHEYKSFLRIMSMHRDERKGIKDVYQEVAVLLNDHPDLLDEFTGFFPVDSVAGPHAERNLRIEQSNLDNDKEQKTRAEKEDRDRRTHDVRKVEDDLKCVMTNWNEGHTNSKLVKEEVKDNCKTEVPPTSQIKENEAPPQRSHDPDAISFVKKAKERFQNDDRVYKSLLGILKMYKEHKNIYGVCHEVAILLNDHPDLLDEFTKFLPDSIANFMFRQKKK